MVKIKSSVDEKEINTCPECLANTPELDVEFMEMSVPLDEIKTDGYQKKIICQPIRQALVNEIKENFSEIIDTPKIVYSCEDGRYHVITKQELVEAVKQLITEGKIEPIKEITCDIIARKSTSILDADLPEDRLFCFKYSYSLQKT
jgi:hypothetical protein